MMLVATLAVALQGAVGWSGPNYEGCECCGQKALENPHCAPILGK